MGDDGHECCACASQRSQEGVWSGLPPGFEVAPNDADVRGVVGLCAWSSQAMVLADGQAVWTGYWGRHAAAKSGA